MSGTTPPLRVGVVGYGLMGKAHSYGYRVAPLLRRLPVTPVITVMSGRDAVAAAAAGKAALCEKPLALTYKEAAAALTAVTRVTCGPGPIR